MLREKLIWKGVKEASTIPARWQTGALKLDMQLNGGSNNTAPSFSSFNSV